jgi:membrane protease YdiL (CAAX protease family)
LIVVVLVFALMPLINWTGEINSHLSLPGFLSGVENWMKSSEAKAKELTEAFMKMESLSDLAINLVVIALLAAIGEELLFRGALQNVLVELTRKPHLSVWITAIIFSALHAQFYGFLPRMLLGVVLGYLYIWSGSLWVSILFHFLNNGLAVLFGYLIKNGALTDKAETIGAGDTPISFVITSAIVSVGLMYFVYKHQAPPVPEGEQFTP